MYDINLFLSNLGYLGQAGRRGPIPWGKIKSAPQLLVDSRFILKTVTFGDPMRIHLRDLTKYWKGWALKESEGDPFSFYTGEEEAKLKKGKGRLVEENEKGKGRQGEEGEEEEGEEEDKGVDEEEEDEEEDEEDEEETPATAKRLPKPPTPAFDIDKGIFLPSQCENSFQKVACLQLLAPRWGDEGMAFHSLVKRVATLEVSVQPIVIFISDSCH